MQHSSSLLVVSVHFHSCQHARLVEGIDWSKAHNIHRGTRRYISRRFCRVIGFQLENDPSFVHRELSPKQTQIPSVSGHGALMKRNQTDTTNN